MHLNFDIKVLLLTTTLSFITVYRKGNASYLRLFPIFLLIKVIVELTANWLWSQHQSNILLYNLYSSVLFSFYIYFFQTTLISSVLKKWITWLLSSFLLLWFIDLIWVQGLTHFNTYSYSLGCLIIVSLSICYFFQLFNTTEKTKLMTEPAFWIITGLLFCFASSLSLLGVINYVSTLPKPVVNDLFNLLHFVNSMLYFLFIIAFVCKLPTRKSTSNT